MDRNPNQPVKTSQCPFCFYTTPTGFEGVCPACERNTAAIISAIRYGTIVLDEDRPAYERLQSIFNGDTVQ